MPIRKENRGRYPRDWREISHRIRFVRANRRCECRGECGTDHHAEHPAGELPESRCPAVHGLAHPVTGSRVVLTVAHLDHTPEHCHAANLRAMCQRCHLNHDRHLHAANARQTRRELRAHRELFDDDGGQST